MKKTILSFALSFVSLLVCAGNVTEQEALRKAQQFMQGRSFQQKNLRRAATANTFAQDAFYVFNADGNQGFVPGCKTMPTRYSRSTRASTWQPLIVPPVRRKS